MKTTIMIYTTYMIINKSQVFRLSHDVVTCDEDSEVRLNTASLLQVMRSTGHAWSYKAWCSTVISCFSTALIGVFRSLLFHSVICSLGGPLSAVGLRRSTSNVNYLFYQWTSFDCIRSFINKQLNTFHFKQLLIHTELSTVWVSTFCLKLNKAFSETKVALFWESSIIWAFFLA